MPGGPKLEPMLTTLLAKPYGDTQCYDSFLWAPLMPKQIGDVVSLCVVSLCVAWRSQRRPSEWEDDTTSASRIEPRLLLLQQSQECYYLL
jgi:hypothetical protein